MTIGPGELAAIWTAGSIIGSMLFLGTLNLGRLMSRMERAEHGIIELDHRMDKAGDKMSDLAGDVQKLMYPLVRRQE